MATVYSYIRFSSKRQELGESLRRQKETGQRWMDRHPEHVFDTTLKLKDLGVSAFRGRNKNTGALGKFIQCVQDKKVPRGSILMLENLDRFSREQAFDAATVFNALVKAGITILVLNPEQLIDESNIGKMEVVMPTIISMLLSNEESRKKSERSIFNWQKKREAARDEGVRMAGKCPGWLRWDKKQKAFVVKPEAKEAVQYLFEKSVEGKGQRALIREMNDGNHKAIGRASKWNGTYIQMILKDRAVLGEFQPHKLDANGKRVPDGPPIKNYFPAVIDQRLFDRAQAAGKQRYRERGPSGKFVNLFTGIIFGTDGHPCHVLTTYCKKMKAGTVDRVYIQRRFVSYGHTLRGTDKEGNRRSRDRKACSIGVDYKIVETAVVQELLELTPSQLKMPIISEARLEHRQQELEGIDQRRSDLQKELRNPASSSLASEIIAALADLTQRRTMVQNEIDQMRQAQATVGQDPQGEIKDILGYIESKPEREKHDLRLRLRTLIGQLVERITIDPFKEGHRSDCHIHIALKGGGERPIRFAAHVKAKHYRWSLDTTGTPEEQEAHDKMLASRGIRPSWVVEGREPTEDERKKGAKDFAGAFTPAMQKKWAEAVRKATPSLGKKKATTAKTSKAKTDVVLVEAKTRKATKPTRKAKKSPKSKR